MLLFSLDARSDDAGQARWGDFTKVGAPTLQTVGGQRAVVLDGKADRYDGPTAPAALCGANPRTIEVWAWKPRVRDDEETLVSWGRRGGPAGGNLAFNWGRSGAYGAVTHWADDMGWRGVPKPGQWHHLVYTYDGKTARLYDNSAEKNARTLRLQTRGDAPIRLGAQTGSDGAARLVNEFNGAPLAGPVAIALVKIHDVALSPEEVRAAFDADAVRFRAEAPETLESLRSGGVETMAGGGLTLTLSRRTQIPLGLTAAGFDFLPTDRLTGRLGDTFYQTGDVTVRARVGDGAWQTLKTNGDPPRGFPLEMSWGWSVERDTVTFQVSASNAGAQPVEIGGLGFALVFNNVLSDRSLDDAHEKCCFADPYPGGDCGYVQVTRLSGKGPALIVLPAGDTPLEAYRHLRDDATPRDVTNEGFYEWSVHTKAWAENEWKGAPPMNPPTSRTLMPGENATYGLRFVVAPGIRQIEATLRREGLPVVVGVPGFVIPTDRPARLLVRATAPLLTVAVDPPGAATVTKEATRLTVRGKTPGRVRLSLGYADGRTQTVGLFVTPPPAEQTRRLGRFHATKQWFDDPGDRFGRAGSFLNFDRESGKVVLQRMQTWMAGLSDEMGAGPAVAVALKNVHQPEKREIALLEQYVDRVLWGKLQTPDDGIRASLYYGPPGTTMWDEPRSKTTWRAYNYPHQAAVYWSLYRLARNHVGLAVAHPWRWYLTHAYKTAVAMRKHCGRGDDLGLAQFGLMVGSVFAQIADDLKAEGMAAEAADLEGYLRKRADHWKSLRYPYGSEMPWDSTGQEEVWTLCRRYGFADKAAVTREAVVAYTPVVPHWVWNGASRRYFDAPVNGTRWPQIGRMTLHYGGALNALVLLDAFRDDPTDFHLLRAGWGGAFGALANIDADGFASYGFDATPEHFDFDPFTADYGVAFFGVARNMATYAVRHPDHGWLGFGGDVSVSAGAVAVTPGDAFRQRLFVADGGQKLWLTLDAGQIEKAVWNPKARTLTLTLAPADAHTPKARLRLPAGWRPEKPLPIERGAVVVTLSAKPTTVVLRG